MMSHSEIWKEYMKYLDRQDYTDEELAYACTCDYYSHDSAIMFYAGFRIAERLTEYRLLKALSHYGSDYIVDYVAEALQEYEEPKSPILGRSK